MIHVENAIILAAGFSSRFVPVSFDIPKGLVRVNGCSLIERQISQLRKAGIQDIYIVTGAFAEQFDFLKSKYHVHLIFNTDYATKNNFSSFYAARHVLSNSIISSSDLYFPHNIFHREATGSYYISSFASGPTRHRSLTLNQNDEIVGVSYGGHDTWITFGGVAFLTQALSHQIIEYIRPVYDRAEYANKYWVDFHDEHITEYPCYIKRVEKGSVVEFNDLESLRCFDPAFLAANVSSTMRRICSILNASEDLLHNFLPVKSSNQAIGCQFEYNGKNYTYFLKTDTVEETTCIKN